MRAPFQRGKGLPAELKPVLSSPEAFLKIQNPHSWNVTPAEAIEIQRRLASELRVSPPPENIQWVAGADCSLDVDRNEACSGVILFSFPDFEPVEYVSARRPLVFPYVPGLLSFREGPVLLEAFAKLTRAPDVIFFDGQGIAHPRGVGIAAHMGVLLDKPTVGFGKSRLCGTHADVGEKQGDAAPLYYQERQIGYAFRSRSKTRPIYVSPGHRMNLEGALDLAKKCLDGFRVPRPTRLADKYVAQVKKHAGGLETGDRFTKNLLE
jgi:deoxyribonuclease V